MALKNYAPDDIEVDVVEQNEFNTQLMSLYDGTLIFSWPDSPYVGDKAWTFVANEGCMYPFPHQETIPAWLKTASRIKNDRTAKERLPHFRGVITVNNLTVDFLSGLNLNTWLLNTGVDCEFFYPKLPVRSTPPLRIGWCGKSFDDPGKWTPKGWDEIMVPLIELYKDRTDVEFLVNRCQPGHRLTRSQMVDWYNSIDVFLCTSCSEGTPSSLLEAMACGRPFISSDVGISWIADKWMHYPEAYDYIPCNKSVNNWGGYQSPPFNDCVEAFARNINELASRMELLPYLSTEARLNALNHFNWKELAPQWLNLILT